MSYELRMAYEMSLAEQQPDDSDLIRTITEQGRFAVVYTGTAYCQYTDGILGAYRRLEADFATLAEAAFFLEGMDDPEDMSIAQPPTAAPFATSKEDTEQRRKAIINGDLPF